LDVDRIMGFESAAQSAAIRSAANGRANTGQPITIKLEPGPFSTLLAMNNPGGSELGEMVADRRLRATRGFGKVTGAGLAAFGSCDVTQQAEPDRVSDSFEQSSQLGGVVFGDRARLQGWTAGFSERYFHNSY